MRVLFSRFADQDLESIGDYIAAQNPRAALDILLSLRDRCHKIAITPKGYPARPELGPNIRSVTHKNHIIFYSIQTNHIRIERILNGRMDYSNKDFSSP